MNKNLISIEYATRIPVNEALEVVNTEGAVAIHNFIPAEHLRRAAIVLNAATMRTDDNQFDKVHRRQQLVEYGYEQGVPWAPQFGGVETPSEPVFHVAQEIDKYVTGDTAVTWSPNRILAHRYDLGDYINKHRDFARDAMGYIAVLTVGGSQTFGFKSDTNEEHEFDMHPGTLTLMRGYQPGADTSMPLHWVKPATQRRLAVSLRQARIGW